MSKVSDTLKKSPATTFNHDLPTFLRFIAIILIVSSHFKLFEYGGGGAVLLLLIVGYNFATFKLKKILNTESVKPVVSMIIKVIIPTVGYLLVLQLYYDAFSLPTVLLYSNFLETRHPMGFSYWFIEIYVQIQILMVILLSAKPIREQLKNNIKFTVIIFAILTTILFVVSGYLWDTSHLYRRVPQMMLWIFAFGFAARYMETVKEKAILSVLFLVACQVYYGSVLSFFSVCALLLIWKPPFRLPQLIKWPIYQIASASLFIYLTHFQIKSVVEKIVPGNPLLHVILALILGTIIFRIYQLFQNRVIGYFQKRARTI